MKKFLLTVMVALFAVATGNAQLSGVVVESTTDGSFICHGGGAAFPQPAGTTTYRVYAELNDATDFLSAQFAIVGCYPMNYSTTTTFFNDAGFGVTIGASYISALCFAFPDSGYDSWMTIGVADNGTGGASVGEAWTDPADPLGAAFGPGNGNMVANDGVFFTTNGNVAGMPVGPNNRVLLGQFTTDGDFSFDVNLNIFDEGDNTTGNLQYLASSDLSCSTLVGTMIDGSSLGLVYPAPVTGCTQTTNYSYCYDNNSSDSFTWVEAEAGEGVTITWNSGSMEGCCDDVTIYDGADNTAPILGTISGDLTGQTFTSTGAFLTIEVDSDGSVSCGGDSSQLAWDYDVDCGDLLGCTDAGAANFNAEADIDDGSCAFAPANDDCANAIALVMNDPAVTGDNTNATADGAAGSCHFLGDASDNDVWYSFVAAGGVTRIQTTLGTNPDTQITIFDACGGTEVACNDDDEEAVVFTLEAGLSADCSVLTSGSTYYIAVDGFQGEAGTFDIQVTNDLDGCTDPLAPNYNACATVDDGSCLATLTNDNCADAIALTLNDPAIIASNIGASNDGGDPSCYFGTSGAGDVWYSFVADGGDIVVSTSTDDGSISDTVMAIYDACGGSEVDCDDDGGLGAFSSISGDCTVFVAGTTYFVQVFEYGGDTEGTFSIEVTSTPSVGCADPTATNFVSVCADGSIPCDFAVPGCTTVGALNYDPTATVDDGSCIIPGCATPADNIDICYADNVVTSVTLTEANPGDGVAIDILAGVVEAGFDIITIYDGADNLSPVLFTGDGDMTGVQLISTGASLTIEILADNVVSCADGSEIALSIDVYCANIPSVCTDAGACNYDAAAINDDGSCDFSCVGCSDPAAINYGGPGITIDDGSCVFSTLNDVPALAIPISNNVATGPGAGCNGISGEDMSAATIVAPEANFRAVNPDLWYSFVPFSSGNRIQVITSDFDPLIEVFDSSMNLITEVSGLTYEDAGGNGTDEIFHVGNLNAGELHYIRVAPYFAADPGDSFDLCVQTLRDTRCDYGSGPYSLCGLFKADYVYSDEYVFNFTSQTDGTEYASNPQSSTFLTLSNVPDLGYGDTYDVAIDAIYNLVDGAGNNVTVVCENDEPCSITISGSPTISMATEDNTANAGPQFLGNYIESNTYVCGAASYTWRFTRTDVTELPIEYNSGSASTLLRISDALTSSAAGGVFNVEVKPEYSNGAVTSYGSIEELTIIGVVTETPAIVANEITSDEAKADDVVPSALIYPNPSTGDLVNLNINDIASDVEVVVVNIIDHMGRVVLSEQITVSDAAVKQQMNLDLASGMYKVNIVMNGKVITETLVIQK